MNEWKGGKCHEWVKMLTISISLFSCISRNGAAINLFLIIPRFSICLVNHSFVVQWKYFTFAFASFLLLLLLRLSLTWQCQRNHFSFHIMKIKLFVSVFGVKAVRKVFEFDSLFKLRERIGNESEEYQPKYIAMKSNSCGFQLAPTK